jgi:photosystem II stability/assembly factor-like uncharacterized protein
MKGASTMDKKLEHLKESMDHTVLKGLEFTEDKRKEVFRSIKSERRRSFLKWVPKVASIKAAWSVLACTVLLVGSLYFAFSAIKEKVEGQVIRSGKSMFASDKQNVEPTYIIYFDQPETFSDISSLQKHVSFKLKALKYTFPLGNRLPEAGTYIVDKNEPITVAATTAENQLKTNLKNDIRDLGQKVADIKTEKQLALEKPMLNDIISLMELKKDLLQKVEKDSIHFSSIVVTLKSTGWMDKLKNIEGIAGVEPYKTDKTLLEEPYPTDKVFANDKNNGLPAEPVYAMADTTNGDVWGYSYHHLYRSTDDGIQWKEINTLDIHDGSITNASFVEGKYIKLYVREGGNSFMYMSSDNAKTWTREVTPFKENGQLFFLNSLTGWYLEDTGLYNGQTFNRLYKTEDGGIHWTLLAKTDTKAKDSLPINGVKTNMMYIDDQHGWITTAEPGGINASLYQTTDGGKTWTEVYYSSPTSFGHTQKSLQGPFFFDRKVGFFVLNARNISEGHSYFVLYQTVDGGRSWKMTQPMDYPYSQEVAVDFTDDEVFLTDGKTLFETKDIGNSWTKSGMVFDGQTNRVVAPLSLKMIDDRHSVLLIREMSNLTRTLFSMGEISHWQTVNMPSLDSH